MLLDNEDPTPFYKQIAKDIKRKIESGEIQPGESIGSQRKLTDFYKVSMITIKKAILELITEGVLFTRIGKGTYVSRQKKKIISEHNSIGLVLNDLKSPYFSMIAHGVEQNASEHGYNLLLANTTGEEAKEDAQIRHYMKSGVDGLIIASMNHLYKATPMIRSLHANKFPYVIVSFIEDDDIYQVGTNHKLGAFMATEHLVKLGHKKIGYINAEKGNLLGRIRKSGYLEALKKYNIPMNEEFIFHFPYFGEKNDYNSGYMIAQRFVKMKNRPQAVFAYNDLSALGFEKALTEKGLKIPEDVAIVGFDDIERSCYCQVPLTTIKQPTEQIGRVAVEKVLSLINKEETRMKTILKPELVIRESCGGKQ